MNWKKFAALTLGLSLLVGCTAKPAGPTPSQEPAATPVPTEEVTPSPSLAQDEMVRVLMLKGPTGLGAAKLMAEKEGSSTMTFSVLGDPAEAVAKLTAGEADIAALPTNLAAALYHKLDGGVQLLCLNTLGTLYILERGESVNSLADLSGKTLYAYGQGANPEYVLRHLLEKSGVSPDTVDVRWKGSTDEVAALMAAGEAELCMLPVPAATTVLMQAEGVREAVDLDQVWDDTEAEGELAMGCVVVRAEFAKNNPEAVDQFLEEYKDSIEFMEDADNLDEAAALAERFGIVPKAAVAKRALPAANLCFIDEEDMVADIQGYYQVLYDANPASIGGSIPDGAFYYGMDF